MRLQNETNQKGKQATHDLPIFFHIDRPVVVVVHWRVVVRLVTSGVVARVFHVRVYTCCRLLLPRGRSIFAVVWGAVLRRRAHMLDLGELWLSLYCWCWGRCGRLGCGLIVVAGRALADCRNPRLHGGRGERLSALTGRRRCPLQSSRRPCCDFGTSR
jgi:hypothetical protein